MKKTVWLSCICMLAISQIVSGQSDKEPFLVKNLSGLNIQSVRAETSGGNITVTGGGSESPRIEVYLMPSNYRQGNSYSKEEMQKRLDEYYEFSITTSNNQLVAIAKPRSRMNNWKNSVSVSYRIYVAQNNSTRLSTSGGNIALSNLNGTQDFSTSGGNLKLSAIKGKITGRTSGGNIELMDSQEEINLTTSGGNIRAERCTGNIDLSTSGGSLTLNQLKGKIEATTSGGSVKGEDVRGELQTHTSGGNVNLQNMRCALNASTSGGNIDVDMRELAGTVKLTNSGGNIDITVPKGTGMELNLSGSRIKTDALNSFSGTVEEDMIRGSLGGGGTSVTAKAGSGRVSLRFN